MREVERTPCGVVEARSFRATVCLVRRRSERGDLLAFLIFEDEFADTSPVVTRVAVHGNLIITEVARQLGGVFLGVVRLIDLGDGCP